MRAEIEREATTKRNAISAIFDGPKAGGRQTVPRGAKKEGRVAITSGGALPKNPSSRKPLRRANTTTHLRGRRSPRRPAGDNPHEGVKSCTLELSFRPTSRPGPFEQQFEGLPGYQAVVGGWVEPLHLEKAKLTLFVNEEGKIRGLPFNRRATALWWLLDRLARERGELVGDVVLVGAAHGQSNCSGMCRASWPT